jgi:Kef-type K+ transport system membrane component KefB
VAECIRIYVSQGFIGVLHLFSQIGVCLFMFVVGMELDLGHLRQKARTAVAVSQCSIIVPFIFGAAIAKPLYPSFATAGTSFISFALFMGIAMSITAFPVLARILRDRGMTKSGLGATAISCAAVGDATAWALLALVVALARSTGMISMYANLGLLILFILVMLGGVRPLLVLWRAKQVEVTSSTMAFVMIFLTGSAFTTHVIGFHALFGAFLAGSLMPRDEKFINAIALRLEHFSSAFLLPLFFAYSGLRTQVGVLDGPVNWLICLGIIAAATLGKLGGSMVSARLTGMTWNDAFSLGGADEHARARGACCTQCRLRPRHPVNANIYDDGSDGLSYDVHDWTPPEPC